LDHSALDRIAIYIPQQTKEDSMRRVVAVVALLLPFATSAEARTHHHHYRHYAHSHYRQQQPQAFGFMSFGSGNGFSGFEGSGSERASYGRSGYRQSGYSRSGRGGRPAAWCGWYMRSQVGADPGPEYNLARSWAHYGSNAGGPSVGTIVVWRHHVGKIVAQQNGQWIVESGNDGHAVRARPRSLAGAIAFRNAYASF
jgi:hypothetical protein